MFTLIIEDKHGGIADEYSFEEGEFYIGRSHTSDIILPSDNVSRRHSRLYTVDGRCYIEDLNSSNGVFVNGRRIHEVFQIQRSAQIKVGDYYLHIESDDNAEEEDKTYCRLSGRNLAFTNQVFRIQNKVNLIGRGKDCTITIIDPSVSRIHAKLTVERNGQLTLEDLKSSNGSFVNDDRVEIITVAHRDIVRIGNVEFLLEIPDQEGAPARQREPTGQRSAMRQREPSRQIRRPTTGSRPALREQTMSSTYDDWGTPTAGRGKSKMVWLMVSLLAALLILGGILAVLFKDDIFGSEREVAKIVEPVETPADKAKKARIKAEEELASLVELGKERLKKRQWDLALETWKDIEERDPTNPQATRAINQINDAKKHKGLLDEARQLKNNLKRGEAAKKLRSIDDDSVYYEEARDELKQLLQEKETTLRHRVTYLVRNKDCDDAMALLKEMQQIDPRDTSLVDQIAKIEKKLGRRRYCKKQ